MAKYFRLPNGTYMEVGDDVSYDEARAFAIENYPDAYGISSTPEEQPEGGFLAATGAGYENLKGDLALVAGKAGLMDEGEAEQYAAERRAQAQREFKPTEEGWTEAPVTKTLETLGGSLPYMAAPLAAGAALASTPVAGALGLGAAGAAALGAGGAGLASATQFTGSNLARQMEADDSSLAEASGTTAALTAVPQAALEVIGFRLIPGIRRIFSAAGKELTEDAAKEIAKKGFAATAKDYGLSAAKAAAGEGATEVGQQFLERLQAGLDIADEQARDEYFESFIGGAVLGGALSPAGRFIERGQEQRQLGDKELEDARKAQELEDQRLADLALLEGGEETRAVPYAGPQAQDTLPGMEAVASEVEATEDTATLEDAQYLERALEDNRQRMSEAAAQNDLAALRTLREQRAVLQEQSKKVAALVKPDEETERQKVQARIESDKRKLQNMSGPAFDPDEADKILTRIGKSEARLAELGGSQEALDLGKPRTLTDPVVEAERFDRQLYEEEMRQRAEDLAAAQDTSEGAQMDMFQESEADLDAASQEVGASLDYPYLNDLFDTALDNTGTAPVLAPPENFIPSAALRTKRGAPRLRGVVDDLFAQLEAARQDLRVASNSGAREAANAAKQRMDTVNKKLNAYGENNVNSYPALLISLRNAQNNALSKIQGIFARVRKDDKSSLMLAESGANKAKKEYIRSVLQEIALDRSAKGQKALSAEEALRIANDLDTEASAAIGEMMRRVRAEGGAAYREDRVIVPAQTRGTKTVTPPVTASLDVRPLEERPFGSGFEAMEVLSEQIRNLNAIRDQAVGARSRQTDGGALRTQFASAEAASTAEQRGETATTVEGELRRRREYVRNQMARLPAIPDRPLNSLLNAVADRIDAGTASRNILDAVEPIIERLNRGANASAAATAADRQALNDAITVADQVSTEDTTGELFNTPKDRARRDKEVGVIRSSYEAFMNHPTVRKVTRQLESAERAAKEAEAAEAAETAKADKAKRAKRASVLGRAYSNLSEQREDYQQAIQDARVRAATLAKSTYNVQIANALKQLDSLRNQIGALELMDAANVAPDPEITAQAKELGDRYSAVEERLTDFVAKRDAALEGVNLNIAAMMDSQVQFERKELERIQKQIDRLEDTTSPEARRLQQETAAQRDRIAQAEVQRKEERDRIDRDKREREVRDATAYPGDVLVRINGKSSGYVNAEAREIADKLAAQEAMDKQRAEAGERSTPVNRVSGPFMQITGGAKRGRRTQERSPKVPRSATITQAEVEEANTIAETDDEALLAEKQRVEKVRKAATKKRKQLLKKKKKTPADLARIAALEEVEQGGVDVADFEDADLDVAPLDGLFDGLYRLTTPATGMQIDEVQAAVDNAVENWANAPEIEVVQGEIDLPEAIQNQIARDGVEGNVPGLYDPNTKKVYIIADNVSSVNDVATTIAHEAAGHFGLRELLGERYEATMDEIYNGNQTVREQADAKLQESPNLSRQVAVEEVLAEMAEQGVEPSLLRKIYTAIKKWLRDTFGLRNVSDAEVRQIVADARLFVEEGAGTAGEGTVMPSGEVLFRARTPVYANDGLAEAGKFAENVVAGPKGVVEKVKEAATGLALMTNIVDRFAPLERISKYMDSLKGLQMMYFARMYDQRMNFVAQAVGNGVLRLRRVTRKDGSVEMLVESEAGPSLRAVVEILRNGQAGSAEANSQLFSLYMAAIRAKRVGLQKLNFGPEVTQAKLNAAMKAIEDTPGLLDTFEQARKAYNAYNKGMLDFVAASGAMSREEMTELSKTEDYVPYYRERNGQVEMALGDRAIMRVGSIQEQPYLQELVGDNKPIMDFMTSSVRNTNMLTDMALRNLATKSAVFEMQNLGAATIGKGHKTSGPDVVHFKVDGEERYALIESSKVKVGGKTVDTGIPAELLVKGMAGVPMQNTFLTKMFGFPARLLRQAVVLNPLYAGRQLFRDSLSATLTSGADFVPVLSALKQINSPEAATLTQRGITGGQVFTGTQEDLTKILRDMAADQGYFSRGLAKLENISMTADALTRRAQYNSYINQGMSEMEATYMALESMNFSKRGMSPGLHQIATTIPFFNAQIQALNVLAKAFRGNMPFNEKLKIREKLYTRGMMLAAFSVAYAVMMQDDEAYQNATPDQKYGNWFIRVPGLDEPIKLPIPFELGYIFKALPEAMVNTMASEQGGKDAMQALRHIILQTIPGGSSYGIPQAVKPLLEIGTGKSFYTGRDLESAYEQTLEAGYRYRPGQTTELARVIGDTLNISPIKVDALVQGYTSSTGMALINLLSFTVPPVGPETPAKRLSEMPIVRGLFQPNDAGGVINATYDRLNEYTEVKKTYESLIQKGRYADANRYLQENLQEYANSGLSSKYTSQMRKISEAERAIRAADLPATEKRERLGDLRKLKIELSKVYQGVS